MTGQCCACSFSTTSWLCNCIYRGLREVWPSVMTGQASHSPSCAIAIIVAGETSLAYAITRECDMQATSWTAWSAGVQATAGLTFKQQPDQPTCESNSLTCTCKQQLTTAALTQLHLATSTPTHVLYLAHLVCEPLSVAELTVISFLHYLAGPALVIQMNMHSDPNERAFWSKWMCILIQTNMHSDPNERAFSSKWTCILIQMNVHSDSC
jgi:hypothetical protein